MKQPKVNFYNLAWRWHFYAGLFVAPFMVMLALTGTLYLFKPQLDPLMYGSLLFNCPALTGSPSYFTDRAAPVTTFTAPATRLGHARQTFFPGARTRAPPVLA